MPALPRVNQFYPNVPLSELSDLYSVGNNAFGSNRVCIVSYLPPTLRINSKFPLNNKYVLFVENTASVTSIAWTYKLYSKGLLSSNTTFLTMKNQDTPELDVFFMEDLLSGGNILFDRLQIICTVVNAGQTLTLTLEHNLVKALDVKESGLISDTQSMIFSGNPLTTNYIANNLKDYLSADTLLWCNGVTDLDGLGDNTLLKIVTAIIYYNIMVSRNNAPEPIKSQGIEKYAEKPGDFNILFNISEYCNTNIKALINDDTPYTYELRNGICGLPLNILNDVLPAINQMPDFTNISATNKILELMKSSVETAENENGSGVLQTTSQKIEDSRQRLITDASKFKELYNLSLFPKSAIKLTAILVKFLLECSKKNQCAECRDMQSTWKFITLDGLKDNQNLLNNVLTHYFVFPSSKVNYYATQATEITKLTWQPTVYTILNQSPRIVKAYFAYKVVREMNTANEYEIDFVRIDSSMTRKDANGNALATQPDFDSVIGRDCYLIVETLGCRGQELTCNVRSRENYFTTQPVPQILSLVRRNAATENHLAIVGNYDELRNTANVLPGTAAITEEYIKVNHKDKAILKISLRPQTQTSFNEWTNGNSTSIAGLKQHTAHLEITAKLSNNTNAFMGNSLSAGAISANFLSATDPYDSTASFRVVNRIVYETYHEVNTYNNLPMNGAVRWKIGRIENTYISSIGDTDANIAIRQVLFYYHDQVDNEHLISTCAYNKTLKKRNGAILSSTTNLTLIPAGHTSNAAAPTGGDAFWNYYYANGDVVTRDNPQPGDVPRNSGASGVSRDYGIVQYSVDPSNVNTELIRMPDSLDIIFKVNGVNNRVTYSFSGTQRRYAHPGCFAAFIGILAHLSYDDVRSTGMCFIDGTSYPSVSHPNGDSIDTNYLSTQVKKRAIIASFRAWYFQHVISGTGDLNDGAHAHQADHNSHLHSGDFNINSLQSITSDI